MSLSVTMSLSVSCESLCVRERQRESLCVTMSLSVSEREKESVTERVSLCDNESLHVRESERVSLCDNESLCVTMSLSLCQMSLSVTMRERKCER